MKNTERKYVAFISYRHLPLDMAVAEGLHRLIERYRIPKDLRKDNQSTLGLVFRDRDELPLSSNLTEDIYSALDRSEFLIVVCTPDTPKSIWVAREIEYFIQKHGRDKVLTVHVAGTAEEAIPRQITHIYDEKGELLDMIEPLSAFLVDANKKKALSGFGKQILRLAAYLRKEPYEAMVRRQAFDSSLKALKTEFLRLVAAILGCPYDSLIQRNKRYLYQRLMSVVLIAVFVLLGFTGIVINRNMRISDMNTQLSAANEQLSNTNMQIQEQMRQVQLNESEALTEMSWRQLEDKNRLAAIQLATRALPHEDEERPYYPEAANALAEALNLYDTPGELMSHSLLEASANIVSMAISNDGWYAAILDEYHVLQYYDIQTGEVLWSGEHNNYNLTSDEEIALLYGTKIETFLFLDFSCDGKWIIHATPKATCVLSAATGEHIWTIEYPWTLCVSLSPNDEYLVIYREGGFCFYDLETGEECSRTENLHFEDVDEFVSTTSCFSKDGSSLLAMGFKMGEFNKEHMYKRYENSVLYIVLIDPNTGRIKCRLEFEHPWKLSYKSITPLMDGGFLILNGYEESLEDANAYVIRLSSDGNVLYFQTHDYYNDRFLKTSSTGTVRKLDFTAANERLFVCASYERLTLLDLETGTFIGSEDYYDEILKGFIDNDGILTIFLFDGTIRQYELEGIPEDGEDDFSLYQIEGFSAGEDVGYAFFSRNGADMYALLPYAGRDFSVHFISHRGTERVNVFDSNMTSINASPSGRYVLIAHADWVTANYYRKDSPLLDGETFETKALVSFPEEYGAFEFCGFNAEENRLIYSNGITRDWSTGEIQEIELWYDLENVEGSGNPVVSNAGEDCNGWKRILYREEGDPLFSAVYHNGSIHWWMDDVHYEGSLCPYGDFIEAWDKTASVIVGENGLVLVDVPMNLSELFSGETEKVTYLVYSIVTNEWYPVYESKLPAEKCIPTADEKWIAGMSTDGKLMLYDPETELIIREFFVPFSVEMIETLRFVQNDTVMLAILKNGYCHFIDTVTGQERGELIDVAHNYDLSMHIDQEAQYLFLCGEKYPQKGVIVDMKNWSLICNVDQMHCYLSESKRIVRFDQDIYRLTAYPLYTVEEMIEMGITYLPEQ